VLAWIAYAIGVFGLSGGMFLHMMVGEPGEESAGTTVIAIAGVVLAGSVLFLAWHLYKARDVDWSVPARTRVLEDSHG
jgi:hypothetical protein